MKPTAPVVTPDMSTFPAKTPKEIELIELLDSDDESVVELFDSKVNVSDCGSIVDLTDLVNSEDGFSDDESHSFDAEEFMSKELSFAGQETTQMTVPPTIHM